MSGMTQWSTHRVPVQFLYVHKDSHQLRNGHGRMSVIELDGDLEETNSFSLYFIIFSLLHIHRKPIKTCSMRCGYTSELPL